MKQTIALINFGVQGKDKFGCHISTVYGIPNYQYDCTNPNKPACQSSGQNNIYSQTCLSDVTESTLRYKYTSLQDSLNTHDLANKHVIMKIDTEGAQWPGFRSFPIQSLDYVDQLVLEIHFRAEFNKHPLYEGNIDIIKNLAEKFVSVNLHMNNYGCVSQTQLQAKKRFYKARAIEVTLVNKKLIKINKQTRSYALHPSNHLNAFIDDCQM